MSSPGGTSGVGRRRSPIFARRVRDRRQPRRRARDRGQGGWLRIEPVARRFGRLDRARVERDSGTGTQAIFFVTLRPDSAGRASDEVRLSTTRPGTSTRPRTVWTGAGMACSGATTAPLRACSTPGSSACRPGPYPSGRTCSLRTARAPNGAGRRSRRAAISLSSREPLQAQPLGCAAPGLPPCPEGLNAYGISGTSLVLIWLPAVDTSTDIAYYDVFRDGCARWQNEQHVLRRRAACRRSAHVPVQRPDGQRGGAVRSAPCPDAQIYVQASAALVAGASGPERRRHRACRLDGHRRPGQLPRDARDLAAGDERRSSSTPATRARQDPERGPSAASATSTASTRRSPEVSQRSWIPAGRSFRLRKGGCCYPSPAIESAHC